MLASFVAFSYLVDVDVVNFLAFAALVLVIELHYLNLLDSIPLQLVLVHKHQILPYLQLPNLVRTAHSDHHIV